MARQTVVQDPTAIMYGSAVLEVQPYGGVSAWVNAGAIRGLTVTENVTATQLAGDNADIAKYVSEHTLTITFTQLEAMSEDVREVVRGAFDTVNSTTPGEVTVSTGGRSTLPEFEVQITNTDEDGNPVVLHAFKVSLDSGYSLQFQDDNAEDPIVLNEVSMTAIPDITKSQGTQLYSLRKVGRGLPIT